jgi:Mrp family chromosome partitioning ATPase
VPHEPQANSLRELLSVVRHRGWMIVACALIAGVAAYAATSREHKRYSASASVTFELNPLNGQIAGLAAASPATIAAQQAANVELLRVGNMAANTAAKLKGGLSAQEVSQAVKISGGGESSVAIVTAGARTPQLAAAIANTYAAEFVREQRAANRSYFASALKLVRRQLSHLSGPQRRGGAGVALEDRAQTLALLSALNYGNVQLAQSAIPPTGPSAPRVSRNTLLGAFLGLLLGLALVAALEYAAPMLTSAEQLESSYGAKLIGTVPALPVLSASRTARQPMPPEARLTMGMLRTRLTLINPQHTPATLLVASAGRAEGTSTIARGLAEAYARHGTRTLMIECDIASPRQAERLGLQDGPGLGELLTGTATSEQATRRIELEGAAGHDAALAVICAGRARHEGPELLDSSAMRNLLEQMAGRYELVLLDAPALAATPEALALVEKVDAMLVVGRLGRGRVRPARELGQLLTSSRARVLGVIANNVKRRPPVVGRAPGRRGAHATGKLGPETPAAVPAASGKV